jgi:hypothetical protein
MEKIKDRIQETGDRRSKLPLAKSGEDKAVTRKK